MRAVLESVLVGGLAAGAVLAWYAPGGRDLVCGADAPRLALEAHAGGGAGGLGLMVQWAFSPILGDAGAWRAAMGVSVGAGVAVLWGLARAAGGSLAGAALAAIVGGLPPVLAAGVARGSPDLAAVPFVAAALAGLPRGGWARAVGFAAVCTCALHDARLGVVTGLAAAAAGGGGWALLAALFAAGSPVHAGAGVVDPVDVGAPLVSLRPDAVAPGLAALAATLWAVGDRGLRRAAMVGFVCALGPVLRAFGDPLTVGGAGVPLPAAIVAAFTPGGVGWAGALVVAAVAAGLGLGKLRPKLSLLLVPLALVEAFTAAGERPRCLALDVPVAVRFLGERTGGVLDLPVLAEGVGGAPPGAHALYAWQQRVHGRPLATTLAPLGASDPLYGEPAVVLSIAASLGGERLLLPPTRPGEVLRGLGVTEIVVHRALYPAQALAVLDPLLLRLYGAPQRDHAGEVDLYRVASAGSARAPTPETLHDASAPAPRGWLSLSAFLAGLEPVTPPAEGAGAGGTPAEPRPSAESPPDRPAHPRSPGERPGEPRHRDGRGRRGGGNEPPSP